LSKLSLVFDHDLKILWSSDKDLINLSLIDIFNNTRPFTSLVRTVFAGEKVDIKCKLKLREGPEKEEERLFKFMSLGDHYSIQPLEENERRYVSKVLWDAFASTFPGGLLFLNRELKVVEITNSLLKMLEIKNRNDILLSKRAVLGRSLSNLFPDSDNFYKTICSNLEKAVAAMETLTFDYISDANKLRVSYGPVFNGTSVVGHCLYFTDIEKELHDREIIELQQAKLFNASKLAALGEMAGGIAHEINNPLAILSGRIDITQSRLQKGKLTDEILNDDLTHMKATTTRMAKIIQGMRVISRDASSEKLNTCSLKEIVDDVLGLSKEKCKSKGIDLRVEIDRHNDHKVKCRRVQISQVLLNLLNNSMDAIEDQEERIIKFKSEIKKSCLTLSIEDNGPGIPEEKIAKIFQPFYTTKEVGKGTGLGLSISAKIIQEHGQKLELIQTDGSTIFTFNLPLLGEEA
tara:strand:- start:256072 stop:257457 length:1386 start_codon:yes stop_codon:yes gene_type:complete